MGFTLVEMLVTLALIGIAATAVTPLVSVMATRAKEAELKLALRSIRKALDEHKAASDAGVIEKKTGASGYPKTLAELATGIKKSSSMGYQASEVTFMRRIPRDPFFPDKTIDPALTWNIRSYDSKPGDLSKVGKDVFDVSSKSKLTALDGSKYADW